MRITLKSKQEDGSPNWVEVREPDDFWAGEVMAIHRAVRITNSSTGETSYSPQEMEDDRANAFLAVAITAWSFTDKPIPSQVNVAPADVILGKSLKGPDWGRLKRKVQPLIAQLEGADDDDDSGVPKETVTSGS